VVKGKSGPIIRYLLWPRHCHCNDAGGNTHLLRFPASSGSQNALRER